MFDIKLPDFDPAKDLFNDMVSDYNNHMEDDKIVFLNLFVAGYRIPVSNIRYENRRIMFMSSNHQETRTLYLNPKDVQYEIIKCNSEEENEKKSIGFVTPTFVCEN